MKILNESAFKKIIFLLICAALMGTCIGSAADSSTATQVQSGGVSVNDGDVSYGLGQQQSAEVLSGDGTITQAQQSNVNAFTSPGGVEIITARMSEVQNVDTPSTDGSTNNNHPTSNVVKTIATDGSGDIDASQTQTETSNGDISQQQNAFLKVIKTPSGMTIGVVRLQQN